MNLASRSAAEDSNALETTCFAELISNNERECNFKKRDYPRSRLNQISDVCADCIKRLKARQSFLLEGVPSSTYRAALFPQLTRLEPQRSSSVFLHCECEHHQPIRLALCEGPTRNPPHPHEDHPSTRTR